jgi:hypothetical protein
MTRFAGRTGALKPSGCQNPDRPSRMAWFAANLRHPQVSGRARDPVIAGRVAASFALDPDDEAAPVLRVRVLAEPVLDAVDDLVELAVRERPDEDHAGVLATRF